MSLNILVTGEIVNAPAHKISNKGNRPMVTAALLVRPTEDTKLLVGVVAFGQASEVLERCNVGDTISASGPARPEKWRSGEPSRLALQLLAKHVMVMHTARRGEQEEADDAEQVAATREEIRASS